jgi:hypothetical protein
MLVNTAETLQFARAEKKLHTIAQFNFYARQESEKEEKLSVIRVLCFWHDIEVAQNCTSSMYGRERRVCLHMCDDDDYFVA